MNAKRRGLGKGLDALLGNAAATVTGSRAGSELQELPVDRIRPGRFQPRTGMDREKLQELAASIDAQGVVQPIVVRPAPGGGDYEIIAGERRWRAAQIAGLDRIPAVVRDIPDQATVAIALIENIQREDLNPLEESGALKRLIDEFELTHELAPRASARPRAAVTNLLRLQDLEEPVKELLDQGELEMGHARALLALSGGAQVQAARRIAVRGLSVRQTEALVRRLLKPTRTRPAGPSRDPDIRRLEEELTERLCARVSIKHGRTGKGQLVIQYNSLPELDGILERIG